MPTLPYLKRAPATPSSSQTLGPALLIESITLCTLTLFIVCHRLVFVFRSRGCLGTEEVMVLLAMLFLILLTAIGGEAVANGFGHHMADFHTIGGNIERAYLCYWLFKIVYKVVITLKKLAFLFLYLRLFPSKRTMYTVWASIAVVIAGGLAFVIVTVVECSPVYKSWKHGVPGHCLQNTAIQWAWAGFDMLTDLWIVFLPFPSIQRLKMSMARKVGAMILFALGLISCVMNAARTAALIKSVHAQSTMDMTYGCTVVWIWSHVEACVGLMCTCVPSLKAPVSRIFKVSLTAQRSVTRSVSQMASRHARQSSSGSVDTIGPMRETRPLGLFSNTTTKDSTQAHKGHMVPPTPRMRESQEALLDKGSIATREFDLASGKTSLHQSWNSEVTDYEKRVDYEKQVEELFTR